MMPFDLLKERRGTTWWNVPRQELVFLFLAVKLGYWHNFTHLQGEWGREAVFKTTNDGTGILFDQGNRPKPGRVAQQWQEAPGFKPQLGGLGTFLPPRVPTCNILGMNLTLPLTNVLALDLDSVPLGWNTAADYCLMGRIQRTSFLTGTNEV